jgi:hypothetical protein
LSCCLTSPWPGHAGWLATRRQQTPTSPPSRSQDARWRCPAAMRAQTALRTTQLLCSADHAGRSQASSRLLARGRGMWSWRRRVSRPATPPSRRQHLCNVRGTVPPFHAQESSRLGLTETVLAAGFVLGTDGSNFGRLREDDLWDQIRRPCPRHDDVR